MSSFVDKVIDKLLDIKQRICINDFIKCENNNIDIVFILLLYEKTKDRLEWEYDVMSDKFYVQPKREVLTQRMIEQHRKVSTSLADFKENYEFVKKKINEFFKEHYKADLVGKPFFENVLRDIAGDDWQVYYKKLLDDGLIEEVLIHGMFFVKIKL